MSMRALASPQLWTRGSRAALSIGVKQHVVAYSTNKRSQYQAISPSMRQAMAHDNSGIRQKYVEQSLSHLGTDITVMEPRQIAHLIRLCSRVGKLEDALTIYSEGIRLKKVTSHVVETALKACFECNDPDSTDKVIGLATEASVELDPGVIATLQSGFTDCLRLDLAYETFIASREKGYPMDMKDNNLLAALIKAGNATHAAEVLQAMYNTREQYGLPDDETWTQAAKAAASVKNPQFLMDLIKEAGDEPARAGRFSAAFYTHLICGSASVDPNLGWDLYLKSKESGIVGGVQHYHLIMSAFIKAKQNHAVPTIYEDMKALGVLPDETTYIVVISSFVKLSQYTKINEILDEMRQRGITPNIQLYTVVFDNLARMGEIKASFGVLEQMRIDNLKPSAEMWSSLMRSMARAIQYERAQGTLDRLKTAQMENVSYRSLLHTLSHIRRGEYSTSALDELKSSGMSFDENLRNAMIILTEEEDGSNMEAILAQMKAANVVPDEGIFNFLMDSAVRSRNVDQVRRIMNRMEEYKIKPSEVTWNIYMRGLGLAGLAEEILKIWDTKFTEGKKNLIDYNTIIHLMVRCNRLDMVAKMFNEMNQSGIEPNEITANILIQGYGRAQQLDKCFQIFDAFKAKYGLLTAVSYNMLVWSCLFNKRPEKAIAVFDDMNNSGVTPLSSLGWDAANEGIKNIVKLEESWDNIQKQPTALENSVNLVKLCVQCNRPDLVQRVVNLSHQSRLIATPKDTNTKEEDNSAGGVAWEAVDKFLDSKERETIRSWVTDGRMSMEETEIQNMKFKNKSPRGRYSRNEKTDEAKAEAVKEEKKEDSKEEVKLEETKEEEKKDEEKKDEEKKEL